LTALHAGGLQSQDFASSSKNEAPASRLFRNAWPVLRELDRLLEKVLRCDRAESSAALSTPSLPRSGTVLVREWQGTTHHVTIVNDGFLWNGSTYRSLSGIARAITGTKWNGPRFFGMRDVNGKEREKRRGG
jgi:hypothetical protein